MPIGSIVGGIIGQSGSQAGGDMAWGAANQANQQAQQANRQNLAEAERARKAMSPWTTAGGSALNKISNLLGLGHFVDAAGDGNITLDNTMADVDQRNALAAFKTTPGYEFRLSEGIKARDQAASARGMTLSGAQAKAIDTYGQNVASEEYNNYFNQLSGVSGLGANATSGANSTSAGLVSGGSNALVQGGNMLAQGGAARGSAYERGANSLASGIGRGTQNALFAGTLASGGGFGFGGGGGGLSPGDAWTLGVARGQQRGFLT